MKPKIYITQPIPQSALERLRAIADVSLNEDATHVPSKDELVAAVKKNDVLFCLVQDYVDADVVAANPKLRMIASMTIAPQQIDTAEATRRRIPVSVIAAPVLSDATADVCFTLILAASRRIVEGDRLVRKGVFPGAQSNYLVAGGVTNRVLGIIGCGRIGREVARRAVGFKMRTIYTDPVRVPDDLAKELRVTWVPLDQLLAESDIVSLNCTLTPETTKLIGERELGLMKRTAYLVNTARGPIVDEPVLLRWLAGKRIAGAGLDVYLNEPRIDPAFAKLDNVVLSPHLGSAVPAVREQMANTVVDNIQAVLDGKPPPNCFNPEIYAGR